MFVKKPDMRSLLAAMLLLGLYAPVIGQQTTPSSAQIQEVMQRMHAQLDSAYKSPQVKDLMKHGKEINTDSIVRAARARSGNGLSGNLGSMASGGAGLKPDTTTAKIPPKNNQVLGAMPSKPLSTAALKQYATDLDKRLTPACREAFGTSIGNTDKYSVLAISNASVLAAEMGMLDQAALLSLKAVERAPGNPLILSNAGSILHTGGLEIAAIPILEVAEQIDPGNSTLENNLGQSYLSLGDRDKAQAHFQICLAKAPNHPLANSSMAMIDLDRGDRSSALRHVENSLKGAFSDRAYHLLYKLKQDPVLMDYFKQRYKQPEYFNENKYQLPLQCYRVSDIAAMRATYDAYKQMLRSVKKKFDDEGKEESKAGRDALMEKMKNRRPDMPVSQFEAPFMEMATAMLFDLKRRMERGDADEIARSQKQYHDRIKELQDEYNKKQHDVDECGGQIALANDYMEKMAVVTHEYQKTYLRIYKDFYLDNAFWSFFTTPDAHMKRANFCQLTSGFLSVLLQIAETHFLDVTQDCASEEKEEKEAEPVEIEGECPLGKYGQEIPFGIGKFNLSCEESEFQIGELIVLNVKHKFKTGETIWALGPGAAISLMGHSDESWLEIPGLGPIKPGLEVGIKGQAFLVFKDGAFVDYGGKIAAEIDVLGWGREISTTVAIGKNSGLVLEDGGLKRLIDKEFGPPKEAPQMNKNVKIYNPK
jgi:tetratricopeptide (TPR) repeat protein